MSEKMKENPLEDVIPETGAAQGKVRPRVRRLAIPVVVLAAVAVAVLWMRNGEEGTVRYRTEAARRGDLTVLVDASGTLEPTNQVDVGSELSGIIRTVAVDFNDPVEAGQVLATLDKDKLEAKVLQSRAGLAAAEAKVLQSRAAAEEAEASLAKLKKAHELSGGVVPSRSDMDAAEFALRKAAADEKSAEADVRQCQATLDADETDLKKASILSPIRGIVLSRDVEPGQTVAASLQAPVLFTLAEDLTRMELHVDVDEADVGRVREGQEATFTVDAWPDRTFPARITQVRYGAETTGGVVTYKTILSVDNSDLLLRPGMTATADIVVQKIENAVLVPNAALRFEPPEAPAPAETKKSGGGGLVGNLFPRPPRQEKTVTEREENTSSRQARVWVLKEGNLSPVSVRTGGTNGFLTEIVEGDVVPGMELAVGLGGTKS